MKVLLLTPIHREKERRGKKTMGIPFYQTQASWIRALIKMGHKVHVFTYTDSAFTTNTTRVLIQEKIEKKYPIFFGRMRRRIEKYYLFNPGNWISSWKLIKLIRKFNQDIIIISGGISSILPVAFKNNKSKVFLFSGVNPLISATNLEKKLLEKNLIDLVVENDRGYAKKWEKTGAKSTIVLPISGVDKSIHKTVALTKKEKKEYSCDVCFIGSITHDRVKKLKYLISYNFKFWGDVKPQVVIPKDLLPFYKGEAYGEKMIKILNSAKIVINFQPHDMTHGGNMRTFEIAGVGAFQLVDKMDEDWNFPKKIIFKNLKDARRKVDYFLKNKNERIKLAKESHITAIKEHTYELHFKKLFNKYG